MSIRSIQAKESKIVTRDIIVPKFFGKRLELRDKKPVNIVFSRRDLNEKMTGIQLVMPWEIGIIITKEAEADEVLFSRVLAYFASPVMARISADTRITCKDVLEQEMKAQIADYQFLIRIEGGKADYLHAIKELDERMKMLGYFREPLGWRRLSAEQKLAIFNEWAAPL